MAPFFNWKIFLLVATLDIVTGKRIKHMIYTTIDNVTTCFRRHNGTEWNIFERRKSHWHGGGFVLWDYSEEMSGKYKI